MVILGLLLIILGAIAVLSAVFVSEGTGELLGIDMSSLAIFLVGVAAGAAMLWGFTILKWGTRRSIEHRRERKRINELSHKLDEVEAERRAERPDDRTP